MDYTIVKADGTTLTTVAEGAKNDTYSVSFIGKNFPAYGSYINNNFARLLENSAKNTAPAAPIKGQLWYDATNNLVKAYNGSAWLTVGPSPLGTNIVITSPTNGQVLKYNGTNWVNGTDNAGSGSAALDDLTDVTITTPTNGQVLKYNGTAWVNGTDATGGGGSTLPADAGGLLKNNGTGTLSWAVPDLDYLSDVVITSPTATQVVTYNGTNWVNGALDLTSNAAIVDLQKKMFLLDKFGSVSPTVTTPNVLPVFEEDTGFIYNVLSADNFVQRNTWSNRIYSYTVQQGTVSVPSLQSFANTSGFAINLIIKVNVYVSADDQTKFRFLVGGVTTDDQVYNGNTFQQTLNYTYTYNVTVANGVTQTFEMQGWVSSGSNGRGLDTIAGKMTINFGGWA